MFDRLKFRGLVHRLVMRANIQPGDDYGMLAVTTVAMVNYPKGAQAEGIVTHEQMNCRTRISQKEIWRVTEDYVDRGVGTLEDLFTRIWGFGFAGYVAALREEQEREDDLNLADKLENEKASRMEEEKEHLAALLKAGKIDLKYFNDRWKALEAAERRGE